ncbi:MAG: GNAT family N-acetyltransferase [Gammaproteobacteria bacterium]
MARLLPDRLQTERLVLREPREADARMLFDAYTQDIEVARYMVWRPHTALAETEAFIAQCIQDWAAGHRQPYVVALREDVHHAVGMLEARTPSHVVDIGYVLARSLWGRGLMPEAIRALTEAALAVPGFFRIQATCDVENRTSARTLEKSGFVREARLERYTLHPNVSPEPRACFMYARCR